MNDLVKNDDVPSPCVGICRMGEAGWCEGCGRLISEIAGWRAAGPAERRAIRARAEQRMRDAPASVLPQTRRA